MTLAERMNKIAQHIEENEITFTNIFNSCEDGYAILQLPIDVPYKFRRYSCLKHNPDRHDYKVLFAEKCMNMPKLTDGQLVDILEGIFMKFNSDSRPTTDDNYYGTSLSTSDVIVLKLNNKEYPYYVDSSGFKRIENFSFNQN